jgi:cell division inhibitor SulA
MLLMMIIMLLLPLLLQELSQMSRQEMVLALRKTCDMEVRTPNRCAGASI